MAVDPLLRELRRTPLFAGIPEGELASMRELLRERRFPAGTPLLVVEQPPDVVYVLLEGSVKVQRERPDGGEVILAVLGPGEPVGEMGAVDTLGRSATVLTLEACRAVWIARDRFEDALRRIPRLAQNLAITLSRRLRMANSRLETLAVLDVAGRVARQLLALAIEYGEVTEAGGTRIPIPLTQGDLAAIVGASRVRVNQVLGRFRELGLIEINRDRFITIREWPGLVRRAR